MKNSRKEYHRNDREHDMEHDGEDLTMSEKTKGD